MRKFQKGFNFGLILVASLTFSNCTAWPAISALFMQSSSGGGGILPLIPGSSSSAPTNNSNDSGTTGRIEFSSSSSSGLETTASVTVPVTITTAMDATVGYTVTGTASGDGVDYTLANGTLSFTASGATTQNINFTVINDSLKETNETVIITLSNPSTGASLGTNSVYTYTITDDDSANISFSTTTSTGSEATTTVTIPVTISTTSAATVDYSVTGGTATGSGTDYTLASGTLTFTDGGATTQNISITINNDALFESDETIIITLANATGANLGVNTTHTYTITNDDGVPTVGFSSTSSTNIETSPSVTIPVAITSAMDATVSYTVTGTATGGGVDYTLANGTLTFTASGATTQNISFSIVNDAIKEANETVIITLSSPTGATLGANTVHTYTIIDDDTASIAFNSTSASAGEDTTAVTIPVTISVTSAATVDYSVTGGTATGSGADYTLASGTLTFTDGGATTQNISITVNNDGIYESDETIIITLANPTNSNLGVNTTHTYTITNDDAMPTVAFTATSSGGAESVTAPTLTVTLTGATALVASVEYAASAASTATSGSDFTLTAGTLTFNPGETSKTVPLTIINDTTTETNETAIVILSSVVGATLGSSSHIYTITDNDPPSIAFTAATSNGSETTTSVSIPVSLSAAYSGSVTVDYSVTGGTATSGGTDFTLASGTLTFASGTTTQNITATVNNDALNEANETIIITLANPTSGASLGANTAHTYTILDDDTPSVAFTTTASNGSEATTAVTIPVTLSLTATASVNYSVTGGTATGGGTDFTLASGTLNFTNGGATTQNISVTVNNDTLNELDETIIITLASPTNANLGANTSHTYTITNDDAAPTIAFGAATSNSTDETATSRTIAINLSAASGQAISVVVTDLGTGSATSGTDYTAIGSPLTVNFAAGDTTKNVTIPVLSDTTDENDETINLSLGSPTNATLGGQTTHTFSIIDDDAAPSLAIDSPSVTEGDAGTKNLTYTVTLSAASGKTVTIDYATSNGTATTADSDYTAVANTTLTFTPGQTSKTVDVVINGDTKNEVNETVVVTLATPSNATITTGTGTGTITNDDTAPTVAFSATTSNGGEATTPALIPVTLTGNATAQTITVNYSVTSGTASATVPIDFTLAAGTLTFNPGTTSQNISITINNDVLNEPNETIEITLATPTVASLGTNTVHTFTIIDDDTPSIAFNATTSNGSEGTTSVTIPVTISLTATASVNYSVTGGTATGSATDFTLASGTVNFTNGGATTENITVAINDDSINEANETIIVTLASPSNANLGANTAHTYTINDNDTAPTVAFNATTSNGSEATTAVTIPVSLTGNVTAQTVTVDYAVTGGTATGSATDFTLASGTLTFSAGTTSQNISVTVNNDALDEANETIQITLSSPTISALGANTVHTYTINDDDPTPTVQFTAASQSSVGESGVLTITAQLSAVSGLAVSVPYTINASSTATGGGTDYSITASPISIPAGSTTGTATITIAADTLNETNETIVVDMGSPTNATASGTTTHTATITDDDAAPTITFGAATSNSTDETATSRTIAINLSAASGQAISVVVTDAGGTATSGTDYTAIGSPLTVNFAAGETTKNVTIPVLSDTIDEANETIVLTLSGPSNATLGGQTTHTFSIIDDDNAPTVAFGAATSDSTNETATSRTIAINLSAASGQAISVVVTDAGGTATSGTDYTAIGSPLTVNFAVGETTKNVTIPVLSDALDEANETIILTLSGPTNAGLGGQTTHTFSIIDDDNAPTVTFGAATSDSVDETATSRTIAINLSAASGQAISVVVTDAGGTATSGTDYTAIGSPLTVNFAAGETTKNVTIPVLSDALDEANETIILTLSGPTNAGLGGQATHTFSIIDDDNPPTVQFTAASQSSGTESGNMTITAQLSAASGLAVSIPFTVNGSSTATGGGTDYSITASPLSIAAGSTTATITISITGDTTPESNETVIVNMGSPTNATASGTTTHTATITDDDTPTVQFTAANQSSGTESGSMTITAQLSTASAVDVTVPFTINGSSTATGGGTDYSITASPITITAGQTTATITITIAADTLDEPNETVVVNMGTPTNANASGTTTHTATITDDDNAPTVTFGAATSDSVDETATSRTIAINLSAASGQAISVVVTDAGGTATSGTDYTAIGSPLTVNFAAGETTKNVTIPVLSDALDEANETIILTLSGPTNAGLGGQTTHTFSIIDDDNAPTVTFGAATSDSVDETATSRTIAINLSAASGQAISVVVTDAGGTATSGTDYTAIGSPLTVNFAAGETTKNVTIPVLSDALDEANETIILTLSGPTNAGLGGQTTHTFSIIDDDPTPTVTFGAATSDSVDETATSRTIAINLSAASGQAISVVVTDAGGTATSGTDYTAIGSPLTVNFAAGETTKNVTIPVLSDALDEANETIILTLSGPTNAGLGGQATHTFSIIDDDNPPTVQFTAASQSSGTESGNMTITAQLSAASGLAVSIPFTVNGSSTATGGGTDYSITASPLSIAAGSTTATITISITGDTTPESNETVIVNMGSPTNATASGTTTHTATITDDDTPTVQFTAANQSSGTESGSMTITAQLSTASAVDVTVPFTINGSSTATGGGTDYSITASPITITAGQTTATITITIAADTLDEPNETVVVNMGTPTNANASGTTTHTATITDDDNAPTVTFGAATSDSVDETATSRTIAINLSAASGQAISVVVTDAGGTATSGTDYTAIGSPLTVNFAAGETTKNVTIPVLSDALDEANETIILTLSGPTNAGLGGQTTHTFSIIDDDNAPTVTFGAATSDSVDETATSRTIAINLSAASGQAISVVVTDAGGTATSGTDYTAIGSPLTVNFAAGETTKNVTIPVLSDALDEANETIILTLSGPTNAGLGGQTTHTFSIIDDDNPPTVYFSAATSNSVNETAANRTISLTLSAASGQSVTVAVTDQSGDTATSGVDYTAIANSVTFNPGETTTNITVSVLSDTLFEGNETIDLLLSTPVNATLGAQTTHTFTIVDDEIGLTAAETMDCNNNGKIDHYKLTFNAAVTDSTFPGYSVNALGTATAHWLVASYTNVALRHGTAVAAACAGVTDTADDTVLYINFTEGASFDTGAKPDLTTSTTPTLTGATGSVGQVFTASVTEADRAKPVVVTATGTTASANLTVTFSEIVYGASNSPACGSGGQLGTTTLAYTNSNAGGGTTISSMGADVCASSDSNAIYVADASFASGDGDGGTDDTVAATANLYDAANNTGNTTAKALSITAGNPTISSIELYDTSGSGKINQLKVVFSLSMDDSTINNSDAARFAMGGTALSLVDQRTHDNAATSDGGSIASPNTDPGTANDTIVTLFTDSTVSGTNLKTVAFTTNAGRWRSGSGFDTLTSADLTSVTVDKAPPIILTAVAAYTNSNLTVDSGDTLVLTFSEPTDKSITTANIDAKLTLSNGHIWGNLTSATWDANGEVLTVTFAGTGSPTIAVGDYITIVDTLKDTASVPNTATNKISANPISGSFGLDATKPYLVFASDITTNSVIVQFSEAMRMGSGTANQNADNISNYTIIEDPANAGCTDVTFTGGSLTILSTSSIRITLPGGSVFCNTNYKVTVASTVTDLAGNIMGSPDYLTFVGLESIKVISATALTTNTMRLTFSKPLFTGNNVTHSAECNTTAECALRYKITPQIGDGTISSAVIGANPYSYTVTLTHNGTQSGVAYTVIVANAVDGDGFTNGTTCVKDIAGTNCVQSAPGDRGTLIGSGTVCNTLACGSFFDDPFFDGTTFSFAFKYDNKIYLGTNDKNDAAFRFDPVGTNSILTTFKFINNSALSLSCAASIRFGYIVSGITGGTCGTNGGANGEVGAVGFTSVDLTISGTNYEILAVGALKESIDRVYYTQDKDSVLDMKNFGVTGGNGINTASAQLIYGIDDQIFTGIASDHGPNAPVLDRTTVTAPSGVVTVGTVGDLGGSNIELLGKANGNPYTGNGNTVGIDFIYRVGSSTYMANNAGLIYLATTTLTTGGLSNKSSWDSAVTISTPSHADFTGTSLRMPDKNSTTGGGLGKIRPGEKAFPYILNYNGKLYLARNVGTNVGAETRFQTNLRGELWTCTQNGSGQCAQADWTRLITGSETDLPINGKAISMLIANGNNLYLGFDDPVNGLVVYRYSGTTPTASAANTPPSSRTGTINLPASRTGALTNGSTTVSSVSVSTASLAVGMIVGGTGIPFDTRIASITNTTTIVLNKAATATGTNTLTFTSNVTGLANTTGLTVGMEVSGTGIPSGTRIVSIPDSTSIVLSQTATASGSNTLSFVDRTMSGGSWVQQGSAGLGSASKYIINSASLYDTATAKNYLYMVVGNGLGSTAIKVTRQID